MTPPIPVEVEEVTAEWLRAALGSDVRDGEIVDRHSGTTGRVRIEATVDGRAEPLFVKLAPFDVRQRRFVDMTGLGIAEARFYAELASDVPLRFPAVHYAAVDNDGRYVMVLEDHDVAPVVVDCGVVHGRDPQRHVARELRVEPGLGDAEPGHVDEAPLTDVERCELDEQWLRAPVDGRLDAYAPRRSRMPVDDLDVTHIGAERRAQPLRGDFFHLDRDGRCHLLGLSRVARGSCSTTHTRSGTPGRRRRGVAASTRSSASRRSLRSWQPLRPLCRAPHRTGTSGR